MAVALAYGSLVCPSSCFFFRISLVVFTTTCCCCQARRLYRCVNRSGKKKENKRKITGAECYAPAFSPRYVAVRVRWKLIGRVRSDCYRLSICSPPPRQPNMMNIIDHGCWLTRVCVDLSGGLLYDASCFFVSAPRVPVAAWLKLEPTGWFWCALLCDLHRFIDLLKLYLKSFGPNPIWRSVGP